MAEKEKEDRKLEIYNRIEAKSFTVHRGHKFKKSDILSKNRRLRSIMGDVETERQSSPSTAVCSTVVMYTFWSIT